MAKLPRYTQKVFGSTASTNQMAEFGSFAAGTPARYTGATITPDIVQTLSNYLSGWKGAIVGNNSPLLEDMNSLCYLFAYQIAYLMQEGIAEWDAGTTYYTNSLVTSGATIYRSLVDTNLNNSVSGGASNWGAPVVDGSVIRMATENNVSITTGLCLFQPYAVITTALTCTIDSGANFLSVSTLTINGTMTVNGTGQVI